MLPAEGSAPAGGPGRRRFVYAAVGLAAAAAGGTAAWWRLQPHDAAQDAVAHLWDLRFDTPQGPPLELAPWRGRPVLVNFWATWCPPCVEELPLIDAFYKEHAPNGWQVVGLAIDQPEAVRKFLVHTPVTFPIALAGGVGTELGKALGNLSGGLPFTVVIGKDQAVRQRKMGRVTPADLAQWASAA